jgi:tRNA dimethylallyltransferase
MSASVANREPAEVRVACRTRVGFIVGPTGSGKTRLALAVAERLGAEIINCDSRQVYAGMDIGTAKPAADDRRRIPHHLVDVRAPDRPLDVAGFTRLARDAIAGVVARGRPPIVVGGSGLYLRALRAGIFTGPSASRVIRDELAAAAAEHGVAHLHEELRALDPEAAARIGPNDLYRIVRALEVHRLTGEPMSRHQLRHGFADRPYETLTVAIALDREQLYANIDRRFDEMMRAGFLDEVRALLDAGYAPERPPLSSIGYRHLAAVVRGEVALDDAVAAAKRDTRRFAKRQLTWFRRESDIVWLESARAFDDGARLFDEFFAFDGRAND